MNTPAQSPPPSNSASPNVRRRTGQGEDSGPSAPDETDAASSRPDAGAGGQAASTVNPEEPGEESDDDEYVPV